MGYVEGVGEKEGRGVLMSWGEGRGFDEKGKGGERVGDFWKGMKGVG